MEQDEDRERVDPLEDTEDISADGQTETAESVEANEAAESGEPAETKESEKAEDPEVSRFRRLLDELFEEDDDDDEFFSEFVCSKGVNVAANIVAVLAFIALSVCAALFVASGCGYGRFGDEAAHLTLVLGLFSAAGGFFCAVEREKPQAFAALALSAGMWYANLLLGVVLEESLMVALSVLISGGVLFLSEIVREDGRWSTCCQIVAASLVAFFATMCAVHIFF